MAVGEMTPDLAARAIIGHVDGVTGCTSVARGPIGNGQETWFVTARSAAGPTELVLRRTAEAGPLEWTDRAAETTAMRQAAGAGIPVPRVHVVSAGGDPLGAPYMVMDRVPGDPVGRTEGARRHDLLVDLVRRLAQLHAAAIPDPAGRDGADATREEVARWTARYRADRLAPLPVVDGLLAWLAASVPPSLADDPAVLLWGDAGAHNALGAGSHITGLLDWELAHHGHPLEDLASVLWIEGGATDAAALVDAYADAAGREVDREAITYFLVLMCVTRSIMIIGGGTAFATGRTHAPNLAGLSLDLPLDRLGEAAALAGWGPVPVVDAPVADPPGTLHPTGPEVDAGIARFLAEEVLPQVQDPRTRRGLKTAVALLDTAALRAGVEAAVERRRASASAAVLAEAARRGVVGDLAEVAARVEADLSLADLRPRCRDALLTDLAHARTLIGPLRRLYRPGG